MFAPEIKFRWYLSLQACVPIDWPDDLTEIFVNSGDTIGGWRVRPDESVLNEESGIPSHMPCHEKPGFKHMILDL